MIKTWQHKGLKQFYLTNKKAGIIPSHAKRLRIILQFLDAVQKPEDMNMPGMRFHKLQGNLKDFYSVTVNGNWRIIFGFDEQDIILVNYIDYH